MAQFRATCQGSRVGGTVARRAVGSGSGAPPGAVRAKPYAVGRRTGRTQAFFNRGKLASKSSEDWCADSRSSSGTFGTECGSTSRRNRRLQPLRKPPRRPMARHWAMLLLWYGGAEFEVHGAPIH
jgi:hypothetical protein